MECPSCGCVDSKVIDSRAHDENRSIKRRRECIACGFRFSTFEKIEERPLVILKADGSYEPYNREKLMRGVLIACAKRPVSSEAINALIDEIELEARSHPKNEISSKKLGALTMSKLRTLDDVAYIRFASVYEDFKSVDEFMEAIQGIR